MKYWLFHYSFLNMEIYILIIHQNIDIGIECFLEKVINFDISAKTTGHEFRLNVTREKIVGHRF